MQNLEELTKAPEALGIIDLHQDLLQEMTGLSAIPEHEKFNELRSQALDSIGAKAMKIWREHPFQRGSMLSYTIGLMDIFYQESLPKAATNLGSVIDQVIASSDPNWL